MKTQFIRATISLVAFSTLSLAQTPLEKAQSDLKTAKADLKVVLAENSSLRGTLYREINQLDDQAIGLNRELRQLERAEDYRTTAAANLRKQLEARKAESDFVGSVIGTYSSGLVSRMGAAERQVYEEAQKLIRQKATAAGDNVLDRTAADLEIVVLGMDRLEKLANGHTFSGEGLKDGEAVAGEFVQVGPTAYFKASSGEFAGVATFSEAEVAQPRIISLEPEQNAAISRFISSKGGDLPFDGTMGKAIVVQASNETLSETAAKGGPVGYAILLLGAASLILGLFKLIEINTFKVPSMRKINAILDDLLTGNKQGAEEKANQISGLSGQLVRTGVENFYGKRRILEETLFERLLAIRPKLDRFLPFLSLVAAAAPLMGLLGTVLGIIKTFKQMAIYGTGNAKAFSAGISEALITTAEGLVVAIPVLIIHGVLRSLAKGRFNQVEAIAVALMNGTSELADDRAPITTIPQEEDPSDEDESLSPQPA